MEGPRVGWGGVLSLSHPPGKGQVVELLSEESPVTREQAGTLSAGAALKGIGSKSSLLLAHSSKW